MYEGNPQHLWSEEGVGKRGTDAPNAHLADLFDKGDPAFGATMSAILMFTSSGIEVTDEVAQMAIKIGRHNHKTALQAEEHRAEQHPADKEGAVVYYIRRGCMVKIGTTTNLRNRMASLLPDEVLATEPGSYSTESRRHMQFRDLRVPGFNEWFYAGPPLQRHVAALRVLHGAPDPALPTLRSS